MFIAWIFLQKLLEQWDFEIIVNWQLEKSNKRKETEKKLTCFWEKTLTYEVLRKNIWPQCSSIFKNNVYLKFWLKLDSLDCFAKNQVIEARY